jgi:hypothetical protein
MVSAEDIVDAPLSVMQVLDIAEIPQPLNYQGESDIHELPKPVAGERKADWQRPLNRDVVIEVAKAADTASLRSPGGEAESGSGELPQRVVGECSVHC